ncbi:MAG: SDR family oxidoreductase [Bacilli bacterium]
MVLLKALITGASSGIGKEMALYLSSLNYEVILVSRDKEALEKMQDSFSSKVKIIVMDLSNIQKVKELYVICKNDDIDILINNAGFGDYGSFYNTDLLNDIDMINLNIQAVHVLTKLFLRDMIKRDSGYILNVASFAAFQPGPMMVTYYGTKVYVYSLTEAIYEELRHKKSNVHISCLCPGPINTNFNDVANVKFKIKQLSSSYVARFAINKMFSNKMLIIPGFKMKVLKFLERFVSDKFLLKMTYHMQKKKK